jgi:hypothetical protein
VTFVSRSAPRPADSVRPGGDCEGLILIRRVLLAGLAASLGLVVAAQAAGAASTLYGSYNLPCGVCTGTTASLATVNVGTGGATTVGTLPFSNPVADGPGVTEIVCQPNATSAATAICYAQSAGGTKMISQFNLSTGAAIGTPVSTGSFTFNGLAYVGSTLYGASSNNGNSPFYLRTLNPVTGVSTQIGTGTGVGEPITGLAWNGTTMYGIEGGSPSTGANLYTINLSTGVATVVGNTLIKGAGSLQFGPDGNLYAGGDGNDHGHLYRVNQTTGAATLVGASGYPITVEPNGPALTGLALVTFSNPTTTTTTAPVAITVTPRFTG